MYVWVVPRGIHNREGFFGVQQEPFIRAYRGCAISEEGGCREVYPELRWKRKVRMAWDGGRHEHFSNLSRHDKGWVP